MQYTTHIKKTYIAPEMEIVEYEEQVMQNGSVTASGSDLFKGTDDWGSKGIDVGFSAPFFEDDIDRELQALRAEEDKHYLN